MGESRALTRIIIATLVRIGGREEREMDGDVRIRWTMILR